MIMAKNNQQAAAAPEEAKMPNILETMEQRAQRQLQLAQNRAVEERDSLVFLKCSILELVTVCEDALPGVELLYKGGCVTLTYRKGYADREKDVVLSAKTAVELALLLQDIERMVAIRDAAAEELREEEICD